MKFLPRMADLGQLVRIKYHPSLAYNVTRYLPAAARPFKFLDKYWARSLDKRHSMSRARRVSAQHLAPRQCTRPSQYILLAILSHAPDAQLPVSSCTRTSANVVGRLWMSSPLEMVVAITMVDKHHSSHSLQNTQDAAKPWALICLNTRPPIWPWHSPRATVSEAQDNFLCTTFVLQQRGGPLIFAETVCDERWSSQGVARGQTAPFQRGWRIRAFPRTCRTASCTLGYIID